MFLKQFNKLIIQIHNISGSILSVMFVVWFLSGIILILISFPNALRKERFMHLDEITPQAIEASQAPSSDFKEVKDKIEICYRSFK